VPRTQHGTPEPVKPGPRLLCWGWRRGQGGEQAAGFLLVDHPELLDLLDRLGATAVVVYEPPAEDVDGLLAIAGQLRTLAEFLVHRLARSSVEATLAALAHQKAHELRDIADSLERWTTSKDRAGEGGRRTAKAKPRRQGRRPEPEGEA